MRVITIWFLLALAFASCDNTRNADSGIVQADQQKNGKKKGKEKKQEKKGTKGEKDSERGNEASNLSVEQIWEMPVVLSEISAITWYGEHTIAAVQDESGIIFIYDLLQKKIKKQIPFAGEGDYEGITMAKNIFYVLRSDGTVIEVQNDGKSKEYNTPLTAENDTEGLAFDLRNNRLLIAIKGNSPAPGSKAVYAFDLNSLTLGTRPVFSINHSDKLFSGRKKKTAFQPSDIAVHPATGEIYVTDGGNPSLLILSASGKPTSYTELDRVTFPQPEGITFSDEQELYISTEGAAKGKGKILKLRLTH